MLLYTIYVDTVNTVNAIYVNTVDTKHIHTFLPITFLIFNQFSICKKFWKAETEGYIYTIYVDTEQGSNAFNAMYVNTVDTNDIHICAHNFLNI